MEEHLKYLGEASQILPHTGELKKVKCHLLYLHKRFLQYLGRSETEDKRLSLSACMHCLMELRGTQYSVQVIPSKKPSENLQNALVREATSQFLTGVQKSSLTKYQETRGKKLVIKCAICHKETQITLRKQKRDRSKGPSVSTTESVNDTLKSKGRQKGTHVHPKKKKKKDQFAGLKATAVMSLQSKKQQLQNRRRFNGT